MKCLNCGKRITKNAKGNWPTRRVCWGCYQSLAGAVRHNRRTTWAKLEAAGKCGPAAKRGRKPGKAK